MGYSGTIVMARPGALLTQQDGVELFGYRHYWLRELGGGWQLVETSGWDDPPDLAAATAALAESTGAGVFAAYVCDDDCAAVHTAVPGGAAGLAHIPDVTRPCGVHTHRPQPAGRSAGSVVDELVAWGGAAGLRPGADAVRDVIGYTHDGGGAYRSADDLVFDLVKAFGVERIGKTLPHSLPISGPPFSSVTDRFGLGMTARSRAAARADGEPEEPWEAEAIVLDRDLWSALHDPEADAAGLARRSLWVKAAYDAARAGRPAPARFDEHGLVSARFLEETLQDALTAGTLNPPTADFDRQWADKRATH